MGFNKHTPHVRLEQLQLHELTFIVYGETDTMNKNKAEKLA
jgi:hypothetical protein